MNVPAVKKIEENPIKTLLAVLSVILASIWPVMHPFMVEELKADFVTVTQHRADIILLSDRLDKIDKGIASINSKDAIADAYSIVDGLTGDIARTMILKDNSQAWDQSHTKQVRQLERAIQYKDCVTEQRNGCEELRKLIY